MLFVNLTYFPSVLKQTNVQDVKMFKGFVGKRYRKWREIPECLENEDLF